MGLPAYYGKFLPHVFSFGPHVYRLLGKDIPWSWATVEKKSFKAVKDLVISLPFVVTTTQSSSWYCHVVLLLME